MQIDNVAAIPVIGWGVIALAVVLLFILLFFRGFKLKKGETEIGVGLERTVDKRINEKRAIELQDQGIRMMLFRCAAELDNEATAGMKRIIRRLDDSIYTMIQRYVRCEFPAIMIEDQIKSELFQRIDENNIRQRLSTAEKLSYIQEIEHDIRDRYTKFLFTLKNMKKNCGEDYPAWEEIQPGIIGLLTQWADATIEEEVKLISKKIDLYENYAEAFELEEYKKSSIDEPLAKNRRYLAALGVS